MPNVKNSFLLNAELKRSQSLEIDQPHEHIQAPGYWHDKLFARQARYNVAMSWALIPVRAVPQASCHPGGSYTHRGTTRRMNFAYVTTKYLPVALM